MTCYNRLILILSLLLYTSLAAYCMAAAPPDLRGIGITARDNVTGTNREVKLYRQMHAVIIGIDKYQNLSPDQQLSYAVKDAQGVEKVLREQYSFDTFYTLYNEEATKEGIMAILQGKLSNIHEDDAVFIFFAGHGTTQKDKLVGGELGYIIPYDGTFEKDKLYRNVSMIQLRDEIAKVIPAKHVFCVIDACYSGTLLAQRAGGANPSHDYAYLQEITKEPVRQVLTAGTDKQTVLDGGPKGHSVFTGRLIEKLEETEDYITAAELGEHVKRRVHSDAQARNHNQTPVSGAFYGLGDFVFVPSANKRALEMEKEKKHLEEELVKLKEQEQQMDARKVRQQKEEIERQKKALDTKQKIEELRQEKIAEAKKREEERIQQEGESKKQAEEEKRQEEERLAYLKTEIDAKRKTIGDAPTGQLSIEDAIKRIKKLQAELAEMESKIDDAVRQSAKDFDRQIEEVKVASKDEFESTEEYQQRVKAAEQKKEFIRKGQAKAEKEIRVNFSTETEGIKKELDSLLKAEYPVPSGEITIELGSYDADKKRYGVEILGKYSGNVDKGESYLKMEGKEARLIKDHQEFLKSKGWVRIRSGSLEPALSKIEVLDDADNQRTMPVSLRRFENMGTVMVDRDTGLQWAQDAGSKEMKWDEADAYVQKLKIGGYSDWRLPTREELESLLTYCKEKGIPLEEGKCAEYYNKIGFKNVQSDYYWSSTSYAGYLNYAWIVNMWNGNVNYYSKSSPGNYVWPVRSGQ